MGRQTWGARPPAVLLVNPAWARAYSGTRPRILRGPAPGGPQFPRRRRAGAPPWHAHASLAPCCPGRRRANKNQSVSEMATEVLARHTGARAKRTGESLEEALRAVLQTEAGRRL